MVSGLPTTLPKLTVRTFLRLVSSRKALPMRMVAPEKFGADEMA